MIQSIQQEISEEKILNILPALNMKADPNNMWDVDGSRIIYHKIALIKSNKYMVLFIKMVYVFFLKIPLNNSSL